MLLLLSTTKRKQFIFGPVRNEFSFLSFTFDDLFSRRLTVLIAIYGSKTKIPKTRKAENCGNFRPLFFPPRNQINQFLCACEWRYSEILLSNWFFRQNSVLCLEVDDIEPAQRLDTKFNRYIVNICSVPDEPNRRESSKRILRFVLVFTLAFALTLPRVSQCAYHVQRSL